MLLLQSKLTGHGLDAGIVGNCGIVGAALLALIGGKSVVHTTSTPHWTIINEWELTDFLYKVNNASFAVFNARTELGIESYFMVLSIFNVRFSRDNNFNKHAVKFYHFKERID